MGELDVVFLGGVFPSEKRKEIYLKSKENIQYAADALQWNIINGLEENLKMPINIINSIFVGSFPKWYKDIIIKSFRFSHKYGAQDKNVGFLNIFGIKHLFIAVKLKRELKRWAKTSNMDKNKILFIYSVHSPFLYAAAAAKKINPQITICQIVPDLPEFMNLNENVRTYIKILKKLDARIIRKWISKVDSFVLLTKYMAEKIPVNHKPFVVAEGMVNMNDMLPLAAAENSKEKVLLYSGTLNKAYGIITLLDAFRLTRDEEFRLVICGGGEAEADIKDFAKKDKRIIFMGMVPREKVLELQKKARALINPRNAEGEFTKYSFPSKNMEYLVSGRPVIAYKLPGIPDEYDQYIHYINSNSAEAMAEVINRVLNSQDQDLEEFGLQAREFVLREKNNIAQAKNILGLVIN